MKIDTQVIIEDDIYLSFQVKGDYLLFEMDEPEDNNLTFLLQLLPSLSCPNGRQDTIHHSTLVTPLHMTHGTYIITFNTALKTKIKIEFQPKKLSVEEL